MPEHASDVARIKPQHVVIAGVLGGVVFVLILVLIVNLVVSRAG
jgi:DUF2970 family protein